MQYTQHIYFSDETLPKDDIDTLFEKLEQLEPPPSLIERILKLTIKTPSVPHDPESGDPWTELDGLVVRKVNLESS